MSELRSAWLASIIDGAWDVPSSCAICMRNLVGCRCFGFIEASSLPKFKPAHGVLLGSLGGRQQAAINGHHIANYS